MRKMSTVYDAKSLIENSFTLPPAVSGKLHGFCELFVEDIKWTTTKTYSLVKVSVQFWGESTARVFNKVEICSPSCSTRKIKQAKNSKNLLTITYKVCTNHRLFEAYLKNCEPIVVEIYSSKTTDLIGKSLVEIPRSIHNLDPNNYCRETVTSNIYSTRHFKLGEIRIAFEVKLNMNACAAMLLPKPVPSMKTIPEKDLVKCQKPKKSINKSTVNKSENKENLQVVGKSKVITIREPKLRKQSSLNVLNVQRPKTAKSIKSAESKSTTSSISGKEGSLVNEIKCLQNKDLLKESQKSKLINYLSGKPLSSSDEGRVFSDLMQLSPTQSLIEGINLNCARAPSPPRNKCLNVLINVLELNEAGYEDVKSNFRYFSDAKFIFKCALTSKLFPRESMNFLSPTADFLSHRIMFSREARKIIKFPCHQNGSYLNFGFCVKSVESQFSSSSHVIGYLRVNVDEIMRSNCRFFKKCSVINEHGVHVGSVSLRIEVTDDCAEDKIPAINRRPDCRPKTKDFTAQHSYNVTSHPSTSNDDCENHRDRNFEHKNMQTDDNEMRTKGSMRKESSNDDHRDTEMIDVEEIKANNRNMKVYKGVLFIECLRSVKDNSQCSSDYFITYEGFWNDCQEMTDVSISNQFNYLKQFAVIFNAEFLRKVQNSHMELKLWEKTVENSEKLIASTRIPLHQFYIAFKDIEMIEHLSTNKLPVISTDTWCNFISPLSSELYCQAKILLAIGSENQIDFLVLSRNLHSLQPLQREPSQTNRNELERTDNKNFAQIKNKLTAFIESLSQKLPETSCGAAVVKQQKISTSCTSSNSSIDSRLQQPQLRKTADLLDTLQKALSQPPSQESFSLFQQPRSSLPEIPSIPIQQGDCIKMMVTIEHAANLPKVIVKKCRNNKRKNKGTPPQRTEFEPHAYATFEAATDHLNENLLPSNTIKSHEGIVYCTNIVRGTNPEWNQTFEVLLPFDVIRNPQKKFVIKVWRKTSHDASNSTDPKPFEDAVIGFSAIDLSVLLTKLPVLSGYYSLVDFSGKSNGQIKVTLKPLEDIDQFRHPSSPLVPLIQPLNIDVGPTESSEGSTLLSRTLKRKFTELDEITQRLRARLFDVTGDENIDPDEEFERDLNTAVDEMDDMNENHEEFGWLMKDPAGTDGNNALMKQSDDANKVSDSVPSTSKAPSLLQENRTITGCSSETSTQLAIDDLLKKYDLDTLINPNIFKNILDPTLANSDSTPTLNPTAGHNAKDNDDNQSDVTTVSSIVSNDHVQMIQKALQRASLHEDQGSDKRYEPDGTINDP